MAWATRTFPARQPANVLDRAAAIVNSPMAWATRTFPARQPANVLDRAAAIVNAA